MDAATLIARLPDEPVIPIKVITDIAGIDYTMPAYLAREKVIPVLPQRGPHRALLVSHDDAVLALIGVALAFATGILVTTAIRAVFALGLDADTLMAGMSRAAATARKWP